MRNVERHGWSGDDVAEVIAASLAAGLTAETIFYVVKRRYPGITTAELVAAIDEVLAEAKVQAKPN
jgi:hypothetical protein